MELKVVTAGIPYVVELQEIGGREEGLDVFFGYFDKGCVDVFDEHLESRVVYTLDGYSVLTGFLETREHCVKIRRAGSENHFMGRDFQVVSDEGHVAEEVLSGRQREDFS